LHDYVAGELAANVLALVYVGEQLDYAANYWHALWRHADLDDRDPASWHSPIKRKAAERGA